VMLFLGQAEEVLKKLDTEPVKSSDNAWAAVYRCKAHLLLGQAQEAVGACEKAIGLDPVAWSAHLFLAAAQADLGNLDKARASLKAVEQMSPGHTLARLRSYRQAAHPEFQRQAEAHYYPGLRRAGMPER
jgi:tetratricopeptide (TPR) repeat protein